MIGWCRCLTGRSGPECARRRSGRGEHQRAVALVDLDRLTVLDLALQDQVGERVLQIFLYRALQRPRAIDGIIADAAEPCARGRSEEHTSELQSLMRISYAVFCLKKKKKPHT